MAISTLSDFMKSFNGIVVTIDVINDGRKFIIGSRSMLETDSILKSYYDDISPSELQHYLNGKLLPQIVSQGKVRAVFCKPLDSVILGIYLHNEASVLNVKFVGFFLIGRSVSRPRIKSTNFTFRTLV